MKFQFASSTLFLATACIAIALGGTIAGTRLMYGPGEIRRSVMYDALGLAAYSPWWLSFAFGGYVLGSRRLTVNATLVFAVLEAASIGAVLLVRIALTP